MPIAKQALKYGAVLIGFYLAVAHATGLGNLMRQAGAAGSGVAKTLQARA